MLNYLTVIPCLNVTYHFFNMIFRYDDIKKESCKTIIKGDRLVNYYYNNKII